MLSRSLLRKSLNRLGANKWFQTTGRIGSIVTSGQAIAFIREHGVVLEAGRGPIRSLAEVVAGGPIRGSWWSHPRGKEIFRITRAVRASSQILVCRLVAGKITFVHKRLWPALIRMSDRFKPSQLARLHEEHTDLGRHVVKAIPFPSWVPAAVKSRGKLLTERKASGILGIALLGKRNAT